MRIFIAGAGEVGTHLAKLLSTDDHDITLMDTEPSRLDFAYDNSFDILPVIGNPNSIEDLSNSGVDSAELFISVTPEESTNMMACILASKLGAQKTLARINNDEFFAQKNQAYFASLGIDAMVYPERLAAQEILAGVRLPWTRQYWSLFNNNLNLVAVKVGANAPLVGQQLNELSNLVRKTFHIVAIKRNFETIIPTGWDIIQSGDILFFTVKPKNLDVVRQYCGKEKTEVSKVIIMGGSRIAIRTAESLPHDMRIKIIESDHEVCKRLAEVVSDNVLIIHGDGRDPRLLLEEGIKNAQAFLALTNNSEANMLATLSAKRYGVYRTVAQIENLDYIEMAERMDIGNLINKKLLAAGTIFRHLLDIDINNVKCLSVAKADVMEVVAREGSKITKAKIKDLKIPKGMTFGGLLRGGKVLLIEGETMVEPGDVVMVFACHSASANKIKHLFE